MKLFNFSQIACLISIFLLQPGCDNKDKWKAVPLKIKKQESFNYSEMISGELDSTTKAGLEEVKKIVAKEKEDISKRFKEDQPENKSNNTSIFDTISEGIKNIYNWFLDLF